MDSPQPARTRSSLCAMNDDAPPNSSSRGLDEVASQTLPRDFSKPFRYSSLATYLHREAERDAVGDRNRKRGHSALGHDATDPAKRTKLDAKSRHVNEQAPLTVKPGTMSGTQGSKIRFDTLSQDRSDGEKLLSLCALVPKAFTMCDSTMVSSFGRFAGTKNHDSTGKKPTTKRTSAVNMKSGTHSHARSSEGQSNGQSQGNMNVAKEHSCPWPGCTAPPFQT